MAAPRREDIVSNLLDVGFAIVGNKIVDELRDIPIQADIDLLYDNEESVSAEELLEDSYPTGDTLDMIIRGETTWVALPHYDANHAALFTGLDRLTGDDSTDNQAAIAARISDLSAVGGGVLMLPPGQFRLDSNLAMASGVRVRGQGVGVTELICNHSGDPSTSAGITLTNLTGVGFKDLTIRGTADSDEGGPYDLLLCSGTTSDVYVDNVHFKWGRHSGFRCSGVTGKNYNVTNCLFTDILTSNHTVNAGGGILVTGGDDYKIIGCTFRDIGNADTAHAIYPSTNSTNGVIANCTFDARDNANTRIHVNGAGPLWKVIGCTFIGPTSGCTQYFVSTHMSVVGNTFQNCTARINAANSVFANNVHYASSGASLTYPVEFQGTPTQMLFIGNTFDYTNNTSANFPAYNAGVAITNCTFANNVVVGRRFISLAHASCAGNIIRDNYCYYAAYAGTTGLFHVENASATGNRFEGNVADTTSGSGPAYRDGTAGNNTWVGNRIVSGSSGVYHSTVTNTVVPMTFAAHTSDATLTSKDVGKYLTNTGASGTVVLTLPAAKAGMQFHGYVAAAQAFRFDPNGTEQVIDPATGAPGTAGKYLGSSTIGNSITLTCFVDGVWAIQVTGAGWAIES